MRWAELCHSVDLPSLFWKVSSFKETSFSSALERSQISPSTSATSTFLANPSLMLLATSNEDEPLSISRTEPSGKVTLIMRNLVRWANIII